MILAEGVGQFCEDLEVDPSDVVLVSWHEGAILASLRLTASYAPPRLLHSRG
jgi:hypothetical protein